MAADGKLVRDLIPEIIERSGGSPSTRRLDPPDHLEALYAKLYEELDELRAAVDIDEQRFELADLAEVLHGLAARLGLPWEEIEAARVSKRRERGGFDEGIWLDAEPTR